MLVALAAALLTTLAEKWHADRMRSMRQTRMWCETCLEDFVGRLCVFAFWAGSRAW